MDSLITIGVIFYLLFVIYAANLVEAGQWSIDTVRLFLYSLTAFTFLVAPFSLQAVIVSMQPENAELQGMIDPLQAMLIAAFALTCATFGYNLVRGEEVRDWLASRMPGYDAGSSVHLAAVLLTLLVLVLSTFQFVLTGGLAGVAEAVESTEISPYSTLFETALWLIAAFLGVGYAIRRTMPATLERLGLRVPTSREILISIGTGIGLFVLSIVYAIIWQSLADAETFGEQTRAAESIANQLRPLPILLLVVLGGALGEEIFMRGALQPVFGLWLTSAFFALLHTQYLLTPTLAFMFVVGLTFGRLRTRLSTTAAIIAHIVYNLAPYVLIALAGETI